MWGDEKGGFGKAKRISKNAAVAGYESKTHRVRLIACQYFVPTTLSVL